MKHCRISKDKQLKLLEMFVAQVTERTTGEWVGVHRNSAALYDPKLRQLLASKMAEVASEMGIFECDERYFGGVGKGKRGRERGGHVYALLVADAASQTAKPFRWFIPTVCLATRSWIYPVLSIIVSIIPKHLWEVIAILSME